MSSARASSRAVADSDDELEDLSDGVGGGESPVSAAERGGRVLRGGDEGSSTEEIQRALQSAQNAFVRSTSGQNLKRHLSVNGDISPQHNLDVDRLKRRKTSTGIETSPRANTSQRRASVQAPGHDGHLSQNSVLGRTEHGHNQLPDEVEAAEQWFGDGVFLPDENYAEFIHHDPNPNEAFQFSPTAAAHFANHEPNVLLYASSTVPNNTLSQQRMIQENLAANAPVSFASLRGRIEQRDRSVESSPAFSLFLNTNPEDESNSGEFSEEKATNGDAAEEFTPFTDRKSSNKVARSQSVQDSMPPPDSHSTSRVRRAKTYHNEATSQDSLHDELARDVDGAASPKPLLISEVKVQSPHESRKSHRKKTLAESDEEKQLVDELNSDDFAIGLPKEQYKPRPSRSRSNAAEQTEPTSKATSKEPTQTSSDFLDSDELASIGLPKEQYKPRPSRRRSKPIQEDQTIDYSIVPERAVKARAKRSKTVAAGLSRPVLSEAEKIERMEEMGFDASHAKIALTNNSGNLEHAIEWLSARPSSGSRVLQQDIVPEVKVVDVKEASKPSAAKHRRKSKSKTGQEDKGDGNMDTDEQHARVRVLTSTTTPPGSPACAVAGFVNVEIPARKEVASTTLDGHAGSAAPRVKRRIDDEDRLDDAVDGVPRSESAADGKRTASASLGENRELDSLVIPAVVDDQIPVEPPKKRGRGRPRSKKVVEEVVVSVHHEGEVERTITIGSPAAPAKPLETVALQEVNTNARSSRRSVRPEESEPASDATAGHQDDDTATESPALPATPSGTPEKGKVESSTKQHSPLNKSKVPYRVGLSKRARIPSLLKVVRK